MSRPPLSLVWMLRLRERASWVLVFIESRWSVAPGPLRALLRGLARWGPLRRWIRID
jgi:hypothetical protein